MQTTKKSAHYVDNKKLLEVMVEYRKAVTAWKKKEKATGKPPIPEYVGACILLIANRLSLKPNFVNYSYREEMVSDGIENCISYIDNFNPAKSTNPFAYFTQIIYYAFLRRIQKEKKQLYIKHKSFENSAVLMDLLHQGAITDDEVAQIPQQFDMDEGISDFIKNFEDGIESKRQKRVKKDLPETELEKLLVEDVPPLVEDVYNSLKVGKIKKKKVKHEGLHIGRHTLRGKKR